MGAERLRAAGISGALFAAAAAFHAGERNAEVLIAIAQEKLNDVDRVQYLELVDCRTLGAATSPLQHSAALCVAAYVGSTRLIDNVILSLP
nr:pantoate--beta-alanine ligase [Bradyrhizobium sp. DOA9]